MIFKNISVVKYLIVSLAMLMIGSTLTFAQANVKLPTATGMAGTTSVSAVTVEGLTGGVASGQARIYVADPTVAKIVDVTAAGLSQGGFFSKKIESESEVRLSWAQQEDITGSSTLFNVTVEFVGVGTTAITTVNPNDNSQTVILGSLASGTLALTVTDGLLSVPNVNITIPSDLTGDIGDGITIPINTSSIASSEGISSFNFSITFDKDVIYLTGASLTGTLSEGGIASENINNETGTATIAVASSEIISGEGVLLNLTANIVGGVETDIDFTSFVMSKLLGGSVLPGTFSGKVVVNQAPMFTAELMDTTVTTGSTLEFDYDATDANSNTLVYSLVGEFAGASIDSSTGMLTWMLSAETTTTYNLVVVVSDGSLTDTSKADVTVSVPTYTVSGTVMYHNSAMTPISSVVATLNSSMDTTGSDGMFSFAGLAEGDYSLSVSKTGGWGGVLSSDALAAAQFFADTTNYPLDDMQQMAADVNNDGFILASDALIILNRVVGKISAFDIPDWIIEPSSVDLMVAKDTSVSISAIAAGDVNKSYVPGMAKKTVNYIAGKDINFSKKGEIEVPITLSSAEKVGAITLRIPYPSDKLEFVSASSKANILVNNSEGIITIAWADLTTNKPFVIDDNGEVVTLAFRAISDMSSEYIEFAIADGSEIVNSVGKDVSASLVVPKLSSVLPEDFKLSQNYPNPFNPSTNITYALPVDGRVKLEIYNTIGQVVATLVNNVQEAGNYEVEWNASSLSSGIYFYRISVEGNKSFLDTKKMLLLK